MAEPSTAVATRHKTPDIITTRDEFNSALGFWRESQFNVLSPFSNVTGIAAQHGLIASVVKIDSDPQSPTGDVYGNLPFLKGQKGTPTEEVALAKGALRKIAECGGISITTLRTDPRTLAHYWEFKAMATYRGIDGAPVVREATAEWDLRDGSDRLKGFTPNQISEARKNGLRNCETRAINAVIRECGTGLKQKYTRAELAKPFVILRVMYQPDMSDPDTRRIFTERSLAGTSMLYAGSAARQLPPAEPMGAFDDLEHDEPAPQQRQAPADAPGSDEPDPSEAYGPIKALRTETKTRKADKSTFLKWYAVDANGVEHNTIRVSIGEVLQKHFEAKTPVQILSEDDGYGGQSILEVEPYSGGAQGLPGMGSL